MVTSGFKYGVREEVVLNLAGVRALDLERLIHMPEASLPGWTIATITTQFHLGADAAYLVEFQLHGAQCLAVANERSIEGVA